MTEIILIATMGLLALIVPVWLGWPKKIAVLYVIGVKCAVLGAYWILGGYSGLKAFEAMQAFNAEPSQARYAYLQDSLRTHIEKTADPLSHLLQARLHFAANEYAEAVTSFEQARQDLKDDAGVLVEYATALYFSDSHDPRLQDALDELRHVEDLPLAAHSLLANIAMDAGDKITARSEWQALLNGLPAESPQIPYVQSLLSKL